MQLPRSTHFRGLATALHRSVAGLPRSKVGDHPVRCPHSPAEGSPHRVPGIALSIRCVYGDYVMMCDCSCSLWLLTLKCKS